jgi:hypothetical protein
MNKTVAIYLAHAALANTTADARVPAGRALSSVHTQSLLHVPSGEAPITNETLIFHGRGASGGPKCDGFRHGRGTAMPRRLNAFFAISVNSPSMGMVNFCSCVWFAPKSCARGVTRRVTPQPTRSAVRMEAGGHAGV